MTEKVEVINAIHGKIYLTERIVKHPKTGVMTLYLQFSNGLDAAGAYVDEEIKKEIIRFLTPKKGDKGGK